MMEQAEEQTLRPPPAESALAVAVPAGEPAEATAAAAIPAPEPAFAEVLVEPEPEPVGAVEPAPAAEPEPAVRPIVIGRDALPEQERKRGWWRR
jgi:ribonuclease E